MGNCFSCCRSMDDHFDDGALKCEQPSSVTVVQEKNNLAAKDDEGEIKSKPENNCQAKIVLEKSTFEMQKEKIQKTVN